MFSFLSPTETILVFPLFQVYCITLSNYIYSIFFTPHTSGFAAISLQNPLYFYLLSFAATSDLCVRQYNQYSICSRYIFYTDTLDFLTRRIRNKYLKLVYLYNRRFIWLDCFMASPFGTIGSHSVDLEDSAILKSN